MDDEEANQLGRVAISDVGVIEEHEEAGIKLMSFPTKAFKSTQGFQVPSTWCIQLSIDRFLQVHAGLRRSTKDS